MKLNVKKIVFFLFCFLLLIGGIFYIQTSKAAFQGEGLTISPPITELSLKPGEKSTQTIRITNPTESVVEVYPRVMDFGAAGEGGEPTFFEGTDETRKFSLAKWITYNQTKLALTPEQIVEFKYTITVPADAEPGGHYGVVFFANEPKDEDGNTSKVTLGSMVGSLVLVRVPGQIIEKGIIEEFKADKGLYLWGDVNVVTRISNIGNVHFKPKGVITIKGWFGEPAKLIFNEQNGNVLPDSIRRFENQWKAEGFRLGMYTVEANLIYGESEKSMTSKVNFWYIPWWILVILVAVITMVIVWIVLKRIKRDKNGSNNKKNNPTHPSQGINQAEGADGSNNSGQVILR